MIRSNANVEIVPSGRVEVRKKERIEQENQQTTYSPFLIGIILSLSLSLSFRLTRKKGHKWDPETQTWGGKGHKQKGASGQIASVAQKATTTAVGQTSVAQWQRLPSQLLQDYCKKNKKLAPTYKNMQPDGGGRTKFQYRVILPDGKNPQKDLFFVPRYSVNNEEQAREEACLLALLSLTPTLPHERTLPEPYRTTWLNAIAAAAASETKKATTKVPTSTAAEPQQSATTKAQASTALTLATQYTSVAEKKRYLDEHRRLKNQRMQRHEAIRMANRDHVVTMSASMRRQIERLLRGEAVLWDEINDGGDAGSDSEEDPTEEDVQFYVQDRLHREGFTRKQARTAFRQVEASSARVRSILKHEGNNEEEWDVTFEECLQWLLIHLDEDQLPLGIDPEKGNVTLDVAGSNGPNSAVPSSGRGAQWGLSSAEVKLVQGRVVVVDGNSDDVAFETALWTMLVEKSGVSLPDTSTAIANLSTEQREINKSIVQEEVEALEAIYSSDFKLQTISPGLQAIEIASCQGEMVLHVVIREGVYPSLPPEKVWLTGKWGSRLVGSAYHMELITFLAELPTGDPMIFELHGQAQMLYETLDDLQSQKLIDAPSANPTRKKGTNLQPADEVTSNILSSPQVSWNNHRRPRERKPFWCRLSSETPEATAFPKISTFLEMTRKSLPAAKSRDEFLKLLRQSEDTGRVLICSGETGCGKTTQIPQVRCYIRIDLVCIRSVSLSFRLYCSSSWKSFQGMQKLSLLSRGGLQPLELLLALPLKGASRRQVSEVLAM